MKSEIKGLKEIRLFIKNRLSNYDGTFVKEFSQRNLVFDLIVRTIQSGESNSVILIGPRGSGKTILINDVLSNIQNNLKFSKDSIIVQLNGLIHTDDRLALKSITFQMNLDNVVDGKVFGSFAENLAFLLACLRTGEKHTSKSVIFILDNFDLFCAHHNQTLLYNLFDVSQSAQAPICIVGVTCRLDVIELLEKRVKSRFSHRQIFLFPDSDVQEDYTLECKIKQIEGYLMLPEVKSEININNNIRKNWNSHLDSLLGDKKFRNIIQRLVDIDISRIALKNFLTNIFFHLDQEKLTVEMFQLELDKLEKDDIVQVLQDLNVLELCLIIAMKHHDEIYDNQPMNFEMILTRYMKFANSNSNTQTVQRPVIMKAFEHIQNLELISMISSSGTRIQKEYQFFKLLVLPRQISEAVKKSVGLPTEVVQWANSSFT
ncbi:unnamed protein product [Phaedon cochleariae]|uniref:Origin recognition complex subunit 4 n=1 Tax=Phaedon cochleariae TaxID=80249 RepID=A0A9P0D8W2_PHACE|nr:unnamed protein product [Phaedon cochleariae]